MKLYQQRETRRLISVITIKSYSILIAEQSKKRRPIGVVENPRQAAIIGEAVFLSGLIAATLALMVSSSYVLHLRLLYFILATFPDVHQELFFTLLPRLKSSNVV